MIPSLRELGLLSARYAEEEALRAKLNTPVDSVPPTSASKTNTSKTPSAEPSSSTIVSAPVPPVAAQRVMNLISSTSGSSSASLPSSPLIVQSPPNTSIDAVTASNLIPIIAGQQASFPSIDKLQQIGLSLMPMPNPFATLSTPQGLLMPQMGFPTIPHTLPANVLTASQHFSPVATPASASASSTTATSTTCTTTAQYPTGSPVEVFSSLTNSRVRKPFHKRRPAHMDKNMLFCHFCGRKDTPEWRKGPAGPATLCNACGLQWAKKIRSQRSSTTSAKNAPKSSSPPASSKLSDETTSDPESLKVES